jgi:hypothetical protein
VCAGGRLPPPGPLRRRHLSGRRVAHQGPGQGVAVRVGRQGRQRPAAVRLGVCAPGRCRPTTRRPGGPALAHGSPQPRHRRADLLPLWPGPAPGAPLALWYRWATLAMLAHAFLVVAAVLEHTRHPTTTRADRGHLQRSPAPVRRRGRPARWRPGAPTALVELAAPTSATRPYLPLPPTGSLEPVKITNYGWRTRRPSSRPEPDHQVPPPPNTWVIPSESRRGRVPRRWIVLLASAGRRPAAWILVAWPTSTSGTT